MDIADKWKDAVGIDRNKICNGFVCVEHFEDKYFKRRNKTELKLNAIPTIFIDHCLPGPSTDDLQFCSIPTVAINTDNKSENSDDGIDILDTVYDTDDTTSSKSGLVACKLCKSKDLTIEEKGKIISFLRKQLKSTKSKVAYLEKTQLKLDKTLKDMRQAELINTELCKSLEVKLYFNSKNFKV